MTQLWQYVLVAVKYLFVAAIIVWLDLLVLLGGPVDVLRRAASTYIIGMNKDKCIQKCV